MTNIVVDIEADGPVPGLYSMVSFGAVIVEPGLNRTFYGQCLPISDQWIPEALAVSGHSREECMTFPESEKTMKDFAEWLLNNNRGRPIFWADNNGFDFAFINYYFHRFLGQNPFGWSSHNINSLYKGIKRNQRANFRKYRKTKHTHHPVDDAIGNAEAMLEMKTRYNLKFDFS
jgi:hypothetical protein